MHEPGALIVSMEAQGRDLRVLFASVTVEVIPPGVFVVANDIGAQQRMANVLTFAVLSMLTLLVAGWVGYAIIVAAAPAGGSARRDRADPVDDLEYQMPVPEERDDISALARNFNRMLSRIQAGAGCAVHERRGP